MAKLPEIGQFEVVLARCRIKNMRPKIAETWAKAQLFFGLILFGGSIRGRWSVKGKL